LKDGAIAARLATIAAAVGGAAGGVLVDQHENHPDNGETRVRTNA
jgi:hypothetical protein